LSKRVGGEVSSRQLQQYSSGETAKWRYHTSLDSLLQIGSAEPNILLSQRRDDIKQADHSLEDEDAFY
jgi:hypothetical protein